MTKEHGEKGGADLGGLKPLLHEAVGELGLVGKFPRGEDVPHLAKENLGTLSLDLGRGRNHSATNAGVGEFLKILDLVDVAAAHEGRGHSLASSTTGATDPVDIVLGIMRKVVVDDYFKVIDIDAACRHVGGDKELELRVLKLVHHAGALGLGDATMETVR